MVDIREIAREIVKEIKRAKPFADVSESEIYNRVEKFRAFRLQPVLRKHSAKYAADIFKWIDEGEKLLISRRRPFLIYEAQGRRLKDIFADMREQCRRHRGFGVHGNAGHIQEEAASFASNLLLDHGLPLTYSSETSTFRKIARLFFEARVGTAANGADIARACRIIALDWKASARFKQSIGTETA
jgi:hypothetical protein